MDMDYIDPEDEFELMYQDEMEMMREMEEEADKQIYSKPKSKRSLDFDQPSTSSGGFTSTNKPNNLEKEHSESLFPEIERKELPESSSLECLPLNTYKRSVSELFGDIEDLEEFGSDSSSKRRRIEEKSKEKRQEFLIETIKNQRKNICDERSFEKTPNYKILLEKKVEDCMSTQVPKWPFVAVSTHNSQRLYLKLRTEEDIFSQNHTSKLKLKTMGLLDLPFEVLKEAAMKERQKKFENISKVDDGVEISSVEKDLWVERYKPKIYLELLSDESTNRSLLQWLKLWDKVVFKRDPPVLKKMDKFEKKNVLDEHDRPIHKVALLCGPPGLGKTTLAHMIARQAGYNMVEVNASDDRSAQVFKVQLEAATQMKSVMGSDPKPNCLILDEIDGAPQAAIDFLVKFVTEKLDKKKKKKSGILKRPIICICNDIYVPALRPLRQIAFNINFPSISSARLGERLVEISRTERILTDLGTMMALSEKTNNDIRSALSILHCLKSKSGKVSLTQVQAANIGIKDVQQGLFSVWQAIFHIRLRRKTSDKKDDLTLNKRLQNVLRCVQSFGDYDRLSMGVFENYLSIRPKDSSLKPMVESLKWFQYFDMTSQNIHSTQNYTLYPYLVYPFVAWNFLLATVHWPKLQYPSAAYEFNQRHLRYKHILDFSLSGMPAHLQAYQHKEKLLLDTIPYLIHLIIPSLRPVSVQLYSQKERAELNRVVNIMADYNLNYTQERTMEGNYVFNLDPNIEDIGFFGERPRERIFGHAGKQMVLKEVDAEKMRRAQAKCGQIYEQKTSESDHPLEVDKETKPSSPAVPNHLQKLTPKTLKKKVEMQAKDFFGRVVEKNLNKIKDKAKTDDIVKSEIWFHFKEGYNNAVRKNVYISDLL